MFRFLVLMVFLATLFASVMPTSAQVWNEVGDAGDLPATAQMPGGVGPFTQINGNVANFKDTDLYCIFIADPKVFSAITVSNGKADAVVDTQLYLFNQSGKGVAAGDDISATNLFSSITGSDVTLSPGKYFLGVSAFDRDALSAGGFIFPDVKFIGVQGPTGPGGANPVTGWSDTGFETGSYRIQMQGVTFCIPESSALFPFLLGASGSLLYLRRRRRRTVSRAQCNA